MAFAGQRFAMMSMKVGLAHLLRKQRLVACEKTNMGKLEVMELHFWAHIMLHFFSMRLGL